MMHLKIKDTSDEASQVNKLIFARRKKYNCSLLKNVKLQTSIEAQTQKQKLSKVNSHSSVLQSEIQIA